jgi:hypothetical protein
MSGLDADRSMERQASSLMTGVSCKARAGRANAGFRVFWWTVTAITRRSAQAVARVALVLSLAAPLPVGLGVLLAPAGLAGCASPAPRSPAGSSPELPVDAVLPAGDGWRVFQLGTLRHAKVPGSPEAWAGGTPAVTPATSSSDPSASSPWLKLAAPTGAFRPVQAVPAQRGYFLIVDAASARLCLYDENAGLLSTFPLPEAFTPFPAGRTAVFRGTDGAFTFVDYATGEAWQFADRQVSGAGATQWVSRGRVKLPAGLSACAQPPGSEELFCRGGDGSPLRFDGALNRIPAHLARDARDATDPARRISAVWDAEAGEWALEGRAVDGTALFRFLPAQRRWGLEAASSPQPSAPPMPAP